MLNTNPAIDGSERMSQMPAGINGAFKFVSLHQPMRSIPLQEMPTRMSHTPPNVHGKLRFIVKVQLKEGVDYVLGVYRPHLIYDKDQSFQAFMDPSNDEAGYNQIQALIRVHGFESRKIFLWAHRTSADFLRIYLDDRPAHQAW